MDDAILTRTAENRPSLAQDAQGRSPCEHLETLFTGMIAICDQVSGFSSCFAGLGTLTYKELPIAKLVEHGAPPIAKRRVGLRHSVYVPAHR